jgi:hypothetical protein
VLVETACVAALLVTVGCGETKVSVVAVHWPLYEANLHSTTIGAKAKSSSGLTQIKLAITKGEMAVSFDQKTPSSIIPLRKNAVTVTKTCTFTGKPTEGECSHTEDFGHKAMISYTAEAISSSDEKAATPEITFVSGYPPVAECMRPVWWHRQNSLDQQIDLCFYPDKDYKGDYTQFTQHLSEMIPWVLFKSTPDYSFHYWNVSTDHTFAALTNLFRGQFNVWAAPFGADSQAANTLPGTDLTAMAAVADGNVILHLTAFRDWGTCSLGGIGTTGWNSTSGAYGSAQTFLHESGHFLHGLGDEYCCDGGYYTKVAQYPNLFASETACKQAAQAQNFNQKSCVAIGSSGKWHLNRPGEIMGSSGSHYSNEDDWYHFSKMSVLYRFGKCAMGKCY